MSKKKIFESKDSSQKQQALEQTIQYEKKIYDLEQLLDIAKSFCQNLDFSNLLESIVYICMAQMHVLGAEIFVRDLITNENFILETSKDFLSDKKTMLPVSTPIATILNSEKRPLTFDELKKNCPDCEHLKILEALNPTLIVPLIQKNHLNGMLILQERIAIEDDASYSEYEINQIMSIASLASVAINNAALLEMSSTDMMTHLRLKYFFYNVLTDKLDHALANKDKLSVIMFDIDFFKRFNDTYGHACGDYVLQTVAKIIKSSIRGQDMASRYGGEEFTVLLNETSMDDAMIVAERIRSKVEQFDFCYEDRHVKVTISLGVTTFDINLNPVTSAKQLVDQADKALYVSKRSGRNRVTFADPKIISDVDLDN